MKRIVRSAVLPTLALAASLVLSAIVAQAQTPRPDAAPPADTPAPAAPARSPAATLDKLFERLAAAKSAEEAKGVANLIQRRWARSGSDTADLLMGRAQQALKSKEYPVAVELLDRVIALQPEWAEGWNQRANALYLNGDPIRSLLDIGETLRREPRHFGAMAGLGVIMRMQGEDRKAMVAYRRALALHPFLESIKEAIESLAFEVDGRDA